jgi:hypothetical protein
VGDVPRIPWKSGIGAAPIDEAQRDRWAKQALEELAADKSEPFFFSASGDSIVIALRCGEELYLFDAKIQREMTAWDGDKFLANMGKIK